MNTTKRVTTFDLDGNENGFLIELEKEGNKTSAYLTCCKPGAVKGYHLHKRRTSNYICVRGSMVVTTWERGKGKVMRSISKGESMSIGTDIPIGLQNIGTEEAWLINFPSPAYDPADKDEQVEYTEKTAQNFLQEDY